MPKTISLRCQVCGKSPVAGFNRPHSLHRTKRLFFPNLIKHAGRIICSRCWRTQRRQLATALLLS